MTMASIYVEEGYRSRAEYLASLAEEYGVPLSLVRTWASLLGPAEDFDALVIECEDYAMMHGEKEEE